MARLTRKQITEGLDQIPIDSILLGVRTETRLTPKQKEFARKIANGTSQAQAYRESYNTKGKKATQRSEASKLASKPLVAQTVEAFKRAREFSEQHTPAQLRAFVIQKLTEHAMNEENSTKDQIAALKLLGTVAEVGAFVDRKEVVQVKASTDIRTRIEERLKLIGVGTTQAQESVDTSADDLLREITEGQISASAENGEPDPADPTLVPPPIYEEHPPIELIHSIPLTQSPVETIGIDLHVSHDEVDAELIVGELDSDGNEILTGTISSENTHPLNNQEVRGEENLHETYNTPGCSSE